MGIRASILKHLKKEDTWTSTIDKVAQEISSSRLRVEMALMILLEGGDVVRKGNKLKSVRRKKSFTEKRVDLEEITKSGTWDGDPRKKQIGTDEAV